MALLEFKCGRSGHEGQLRMDGVDISRHVNAVSITADVGNATKATIQLVAPVLDFTVDANVTFVVQSDEGFIVVEESLPDGRKRYRTVRAESSEGTGL